MCNVKNLVYRIKCNICDAKYVGETHRTFESRIKEHTKNNSAMHDHFTSNHSCPPSLDQFEIKILKTGFTNTLERKEAESLYIAKENPIINIQHP